MFHCMECSTRFIICYICKCGCHVDVCCFRAIINWINYANESCSTIYYFRFTYGNLITFTFGFCPISLEVLVVFTDAL